MRQKVIHRDGYNYIVNHLYSDSHYGHESVYHIHTNNPKWACGIMNEIVGYPDVESKEEHDMRYKREPNILNALKPYWKCEFVNHEDVCFYPTSDGEYGHVDVDLDGFYIFTYVEPYDD